MGTPHRHPDRIDFRRPIINPVAPELHPMVLLQGANRGKAPCISQRCSPNIRLCDFKPSATGIEGTDAHQVVLDAALPWLKLEFCASASPDPALTARTMPRSTTIRTE